MESPFQQNCHSKRAILRRIRQTNRRSDDDVPERPVPLLSGRLSRRSRRAIKLRKSTFATNPQKNIYKSDSFQGDKMSMFVILPRKKQTLEKVLQLLTTMPIAKLIEILADAEQQFVDEDVEVYLPRFDTNSDLNLNIVLQQMGITEIFDPDVADLLGIYPEYLYVSRIIQKAEIEVNEEGTVAAAAAGKFTSSIMRLGWCFLFLGGAFAYKSPPPIFRANKPFAYLIIDKQTRSIVFAGKVSSPKIR